MSATGAVMNTETQVYITSVYGEREVYRELGPMDGLALPAAFEEMVIAMGGGAFVRVRVIRRNWALHTKPDGSNLLTCELVVSHLEDLTVREMG